MKYVSTLKLISHNIWVKSLENFLVAGSPVILSSDSPFWVFGHHMTINCTMSTIYVSTLKLGCYPSHAMGLAAPGYTKHPLSSWHLISSFFTYWDVVVLSFPHFIVLRIKKFVTGLMQNMGCSTCSNHLSRSLWKTAVIFSMPRFLRSEAEGVSYWSLVQQIKWIIEQSQSTTLNYCPTSNISHTKFQNIKVSHLALQLSLPNPLKPGVKSWMKM